jgi:sugar transferase (PEP-CTERM/EpsH1 system associated)
MRILYLAQRVPYPPDRGDKIATYHHIRHLARQHEVAVACLADGEADLANVAPLSTMVESVDAVVLSGARGRMRALAALAGKLPLTLAYFGEPELHARVRELVRAGRFDAIVIYSSGMAQFAEAVTGVPRVMVFSDLDSMKWRQYADNVPPPMGWVYGLEARRLLRYERYLAVNFEHSVVCTAPELEDCRRLMPGAQVSCVSNGVDIEYFRPADRPVRSHALVFTGVMDYLPNVDGVAWFSEQVLPIVRAHVPDVTFTICGARPSPRVRALARVPGVTVTGRVPDVRPYLAAADACIVPLRIARGIQNKLLEAMAMGLPTVATTAAFLGVDAEPGADLLVADGTAEFAGAVTRLLEDDDLRLRMGRAARAAIERRYAWEATLGGLDRVLEDVVSARRFTGDMSAA